VLVSFSVVFSVFCIETKSITNLWIIPLVLLQAAVSGEIGNLKRKNKKIEQQLEKIKMVAPPRDD
jgi:hypothetical protein